MPGFNFSIGPFSFLALEGEPGIYQEALEVLSLPFRDGETIRSLGKHSEPFTLRSVVDQTSEAAALDLQRAYATLIGAGSQVLVWRSVDLSTSLFFTSFKVDVLSVQPLPIQPARRMLNGLNVSNGSNGVVLRANWMLRSVPV